MRDVFGWFSRAWGNYPERALILLLLAAALSLIVGTLARLLRFFRMDPDDVRRLPLKERIARTIAKAPLPQDEP